VSGGEFELTTPVAMLVFNRPEQTARVFAEVRRARPPVLLLVADGPRADRPGEADLCARTRAIVQDVDWPCRVLSNFADANLGCKGRVASGVRWVFEQCEEAIVLEDDCLPDPTFFRFCQEVLARYRDDPRVYMICGHNFLRGRKRRNPDSYYFTKYTHVWGWASWRRAIQTHYDPDARAWPEMRDGGWLRDYLHNDEEVAYWTPGFEDVYTGRLDTWDYQMSISAWANNLLSIIPSTNLITNIGFGPQATHTMTGTSDLANMPLEPMTFPLRHPNLMIRDAWADEIMRREIYRLPSFARKVRRRLKHLFRRNP
jgi:hypothetical protein